MGIQVRVKKYKSGTHSLYLDIYENGNRRAEFLGITYDKSDSTAIRKEKYELANNIKAKMQLEKESGDYGFIPSHRKKASFNDYYNNFLDGYERNDKRMFKYAYEKFVEHTQFKRITANQITYKLIDEFKDYLKSEGAGLSGETPQNYFRRFRHVLNKASLDGLISPVVISKIQTIKIKRKPNTQLVKEVFSVDELKLLQNTACGNEEVKRAFLFACFTGLGEAEIRALKWDRIQGDKMKIFREKTGEPVFNKLSATALSLLGEKPSRGGFVFRLPSTVAVSKDLKRWVKRAGIDKNVSFYCGRHSFAVMLLLTGANLKTVADCMGHSETKSTVRYLNYVNALKEEAIDNLPSI